MVVMLVITIFDFGETLINVKFAPRHCCTHCQQWTLTVKQSSRSTWFILLSGRGSKGILDALMQEKKEKKAPELVLPTLNSSCVCLQWHHNFHPRTSIHLSNQSKKQSINKVTNHSRLIRAKVWEKEENEQSTIGKTVSTTVVYCNGCR